MPSPGGVFAEESPYGSKVLKVFKVLRVFKVLKVVKVLRVFKVLRDIDVFKVSKAVRGKGFLIASFISAKS